MLEKFLTETLKLAPRQMWGVEQQKIYFKKIFTSFQKAKQNRPTSVKKVGRHISFSLKITKISCNFPRCSAIIKVKNISCADNREACCRADHHGRSCGSSFSRFCDW